MLNVFSYSSAVLIIDGEIKWVAFLGQKMYRINSLYRNVSYLKQFYYI